MAKTKSYKPIWFFLSGNLYKIQIVFVVLFSALLFFPFVGCSRQRYRKQVDGEVNELLSALTRDKRWELIDYSLNPSQHSRFYDPYNPDCEPMPPDDATAHRYMHHVNGMKNGNWDEKGRTNFVENPYWQKYVLFDDEGYVTLDKETAFQLAQIHSPDYQTALENLYLSALAVSFQRFQFDTQFYGGSSMFYSSNGAVRDSTWTNKNRLSFDKKVATGGQAVVELANSITWQVAGPDTQQYQTILSASFLQPFLRNGGREYVLENLTRSERNLLANVRQMAYYRQGFYKTVIFGGNNVPMPSTTGSPGTSSGGSSLTGGYVSLLASQVRIANQRNNVISTRDTERQFFSLFEANRIQYIQVEQARASYLSSQSQLMSQVNSYNSTVEQFVSNRLGLPPDLKVKIQDPLLDQFEIMSPELTSIQEGLEEHFLVVRDNKQQISDTLIDRLNDLCNQLKGEITNVYADIEKLEAKMPERISNIRFLEQQTEQFEGYIDPASFSEDTFVERVTHLRREVPKLESDLRMTFRLIENVRKINRQDLVTMLGMGRIDPESMECLFALKMNLILNSTSLLDQDGKTWIILDDGKTLALLGKYGKPLLDEEGRTVDEEGRLVSRLASDAQKDPYRYFMTLVMRKLTGDVRQLSLEQARARLDAISMTPIDITPETAIKVASQYRLDWMNARADLVNNWRDIEIAANQLQSVLNFRVDGDIGTNKNNPVAFNKRNGRISVGVEWDAPLTRLTERNAYRTAQINYQRSRRNYYNFVDGVNRSLRDSLRNVENVQFDFEVQRRAVLVAISRVHLAQLAMEQPPAVGQTSENMSNTLARDLVEALNSLLDAQNRFMAIWVDHYGMRSTLCLDLGIMQLDENGVWLDPGSIRESDYNQLVSRENDDVAKGMVLPAAPALPGGHMPQLAPAIPDVEGMVYPRELRQAPPAPKAFVSGEMLPPEVTPRGSTVPMLRTPPATMDFAPPVPVPSALPGSSEDQQATEMPDATRVIYQNPIMQRRLPSATLLKNYGEDSIQRLPDVEEVTDETAEDEMPSPTPDSISTMRPGASRSVTVHSAQLGAGQSLQTNSIPISIPATQSLPAPYSPHVSGLPASASPGSVKSIEQVGYRGSVDAGNSPTATASQTMSVVSINNAQIR